MLKLMKNVIKQKRQEGFTIIEVMIVLAIAAVILLIVLLAVPALQRNSRNTQRNNDAATFAAAVNTCLANHNNVVAQCSSVGVNNVDVDLTKLGQLTTSPSYSAGTGSTTQMNWQFQQQCNAAGTGYGGGSYTARVFAITFQVETTGAAANRCIDS